MSLKVKAKVSSVVKYQVPEYIRTNSSNFDEFLSHYYKFLEQTDQPLDFIRNADHKFDVDNTTEQFRDKIKAGIFPFDIDNVNQIISDAELIKHAKELYLRKGSEDSYKFLFNNILGNDIEMDYGRKHVLRPSDNEYINKITCVLSSVVPGRDLSIIEGKLIEQNGKQILIEEVEPYEYDDSYYVCKINPTFGEHPSLDFNKSAYFTINNETWELNVSALVSSAPVVDGGALYQVGQKLLTVGGSGTGAEMIVSEVAGGSVEDIMIITPGTGYNVGDVITFPAPETNNIATAVVEAVDGHGAVITPRWKIATATVDESDYGYSVNEYIPISDPECTLRVASVTSNQLTAIDITNGGSGYTYAKSLFYNGVSYFNTDCTVLNGKITSVAIPSTLITATPTFWINGSGCAGTITVTGGIITNITVSTAGINYQSPILNITGLGDGYTVPKLYPTYDANKGITAIYYNAGDTHFNSSYSLPNGTHSFTITEERGSGFAGTAVMGGRITSVTITTPGAVIGELQTKITDGRSTFNVSYQLRDFLIDNSGINYVAPTVSWSGGEFASGSAYPTVSLGWWSETGTISSADIWDSGDYFSVAPTMTLSDGLVENYTIPHCSMVEGSTTITTTDNGFNQLKVGHKMHYPTLSYYNVALMTTIGPNEIEVDQPAPDTVVDFTLIVTVARGKLSKLKITNAGSGYVKLPMPVTPDRVENNDSDPMNNTTLAKLVPISTSIGKITKVNVIKHGINYEDHPLIATPYVAITENTSPYLNPGDLVINGSWTYVDEVDYTDGPRGIVRSYDPSRNLLIIDGASDEFIFCTEDNDIIMDEDVSPIHHEHSLPFGLVGDEIYAPRSNVSTYPLVTNRANILAITDSMVNHEQYFTSDLGTLSNDNIRLHDGVMIQDYSYIITTIDTVIDGVKRLLQYGDYDKIVKDVLHPAGYRLFGKTKMLSELQIPFSLGAAYGLQTDRAVVSR